MSDRIIRVENLGKTYIIRHQQKEPYTALRDVITNGVKSFAGNLVKGQTQRLDNPLREEFWALKDVSFEIQRGDRVGIIGRNGAGKSTLLKILSRITEPTKGKINIKGRVASLLEVGTGFHPELTGRENIYLNGAILGMSKVEIKKKFDEIVAFAEVEKFLDTPVKRYSSGMYVRLAFAVAAHLEPEILIVDEVLAVGDMQFQKKCLGKMEDVSKEGRTLLFVSHNMHTVSSLCNQAIFLKQGQIVCQGYTKDIIEKYLLSGLNHAGEVLWNFDESPSHELVKLHAVRVLNQKHQLAHEISIAEEVILEMEFWCLKKTRLSCHFHIYSQDGILIFVTTNMHDVWGQREYTPGLYKCGCVIPGNFLNEGRHHVTLYISEDTTGFAYIEMKEVVLFHMVEVEHHKGRGNFRGNKWSGLVRPVLPWTGMRVEDL
ncbi:ABC transporter ATP-binding protein [Roseofilum reptotaenium CS-1145]|uniref:ABC transporter domain-containing protein n=1 Tax=Roseofilum reptotaenium AO1-A TaxID=1925591 RepID=A0A1L9QSC9_9CYAN|nr:ABC transporter ATP-binding protein [Roseofilum reptotaenium]MDB9518268.1 ABC transporter ATP-binding protein [Roseofilum reptotaenium CS-1145]OJJ25552.1 hypothetical protein BI308_11215 [Roseofilum reptotaenium AO1-A]